MEERLTRGTGVAGNFKTPGNVQATGVSRADGGRSVGAAGAAGSENTIVKTLTGVADATATPIATVTVPNAIMGAAIRVTVVGTLGDGDSSDSNIWMIGISRVAGAATKAVVSSVGVDGATTGVSGNAATLVTVSGNTGANSASQTFTINATVTKSAGTAGNHRVTAEIAVLNSFASGVTVA